MQYVENYLSSVFNVDKIGFDFAFEISPAKAGLPESNVQIVKSGFVFIIV